MLPDLKSTKQKLHVVHMDLITALMNRKLGVFGQVPRHVIHEGHAMRTERADGSIEDGALHTASAETSIAIDDIPRMTSDQRYALLESIAEQMASAVSGKFFSYISEVADQTGQVVEASGEFGPRTIFAVLEKMELNFDPSGAIKGLSICVGPKQEAAMRAAFVQIQGDPTLFAEYKGLIARKWEAWRDREAARKLVG